MNPKDVKNIHKLIRQKHSPSSLSPEILADIIDILLMYEIVKEVR